MGKRFVKLTFCCSIICFIMHQHIRTLPVYSQSEDITEIQKSASVGQENDETETGPDVSDKSAAKKEKISRDIILRPITVKGSATSKRKDKDIQKVSRHTMTLRDLKEVPATFGDSINALTSLPGIIRGGDGLFGPLVIRGADIRFNNYFIDDIPIFNPLHYGGMHSIINNNLMSDIDLYASSFPVDFGSALGAVININTIDDIEKFGGYADISLISANVLIQTTITRNELSDLSLRSPAEKKYNINEKNTGYCLVSGRYGYIGLLTPYMTPKEQRDKMEVSPEYWDYQAKCKYYFNSSNSITLLVLGASDYIKFKQKKSMKAGDDPYQSKVDFKTDQFSNSQGLYYTFQPSKKIENKLISYCSFEKNYMYLNFPVEGGADWAKDIHITSRVYIIGLKDKFRFEWWEKHAEFDAGIEYTMYYFSAHGKSLIPRGYFSIFDISDPDLMLAYNLDEKTINHVMSAFVKNKFTFGKLTILPGIRSDYLERAAKATCDPRVMISYEFPTETTISAAGGKYSYFLQTNPFVFNNMPDLTRVGSILKSEKAIHRTIGIEQNVALNTIKIEGFYNNYYDMGQPYPHLEPDGTYLQGMNSGKVTAKGVEIMIQRDRKGGRNDFFGWLSYTYTISRYKSGLPTVDGLHGFVDENGAFINKAGDEYGDKWINFEFEQKHSLKLTAGYDMGNHTFSARFQLYSSFPYTPIIGSELDMDYFNRTGLYRFIPITGKRNIGHFPSHHRLDVRYSYTINHSWGYVRWYVEIINIYNNRAVNEHQWDYRYPYSANNPKNDAPEDDFMLGMVPNFGVEVKF